MRLLIGSLGGLCLSSTTPDIIIHSIMPAKNNRRPCKLFTAIPETMITIAAATIANPIHAVHRGNLAVCKIETDQLNIARQNEAV